MKLFLAILAGVLIGHSIPMIAVNVGMWIRWRRIRRAAVERRLCIVCKHRQLSSSDQCKCCRTVYDKPRFEEDKS